MENLHNKEQYNKDIVLLKNSINELNTELLLIFPFTKLLVNKDHQLYKNILDKLFNISFYKPKDDINTIDSLYIFETFLKDNIVSIKQVHDDFYKYCNKNLIESIYECRNNILVNTSFVDEIKICMDFLKDPNKQMIITTEQKKNIIDMNILQYFEVFMEPEELQKNRRNIQKLIN